LQKSAITPIVSTTISRPLLKERTVEETTEEKAASNTVLAIAGQLIVLIVGIFVLLSGIGEPKVIAITLATNFVAAVIVIITRNETLAKLSGLVALGSGAIAIAPLMISIASWLDRVDWKDLFKRLYREDHEL